MSSGAPSLADLAIQHERKSALSPASTNGPSLSDLASSHRAGPSLAELAKKSSAGPSLVDLAKKSSAGPTLDLPNAHKANNDKELSKAGPSLTDLANAHQANTGPSLAALASSSGPSLSELASKGSSSNTIKCTNNNLPQASSSLQSLAKTHLGGESKATFQIPDLFNSGKVKSVQVDQAEVPLDLMRALRLDKEERKSERRTNRVSPEKAEKEREDDICLTLEALINELRSSIDLQNAVDVTSTSPFSGVICRRWPKKETNVKVKVKEFSLKAFSFDTLSPDDVVLEAQKSAKFRRTATVSSHPADRPPMKNGSKMK